MWPKDRSTTEIKRKRCYVLWRWTDFEGVGKKADFHHQAANFRRQSLLKTHMHFGILKKFVCAFLVVALLPLVGLSLFTWLYINQAGVDILDSSQTSLKHYSITLLETQVKTIANEVEDLLATAVSDLQLLSIVPPTPDAFEAFVRARTREVWTPDPSTAAMGKTLQSLPLYCEASFIDRSGIERISIRGGHDTSGCDVSAGAQSVHGPENYFCETRDLAPGEIYVSHLVGWHMDREPTGGGPGAYRGYYRFAQPVYREGVFTGVITLALDQRHLMELTQHVLPFGMESVVSPDYFSGDYAFLFDDEGWAITHPKAWDIRGADRRTGRLVDPRSDTYTEAALKSGAVPFNLLHVPFIHPSYQEIAQNALSGNAGIARARNVSGIPRILAYAPIRFSHGAYGKSGVFGGVTLGAQINLFRQIVTETSRDIDGLLKKILRNLAVFIVLSGVGVTFIAIWLARSFTRPILAIKDGVGEISRGNYAVDLPVSSRDELSLLANDVCRLGIQLKKHVQDIDAHYVERARLMEDALKRRQLVESVFTNILSGLVVFDHQGVILSANPRAADFLKQHEAELIGRHVNDIFGPFPKMLDLIVGERDQPDPVLSSIDMKLPDGQTIYFETTRARLVSETDPGEKKILFIFRDVTKRKTMEAQLNRSNRLVSMGILAAGIAHEIRNPLTGISLMLDDLHDRMATRTEERLMMESALNEIEKLDAIISELLAFASKSTTNPKASDLNHAVNLTLFFVQKQYKKARITLTKDLCTHLPPIQIDTEKMKQALLNILLNALAALSETDNGQVTITTAFVPASDILGGKPAVISSVRDNGPGIAKKDLEFIFDPFYTQKAGGFGLGLSITHTIIEEHAGKILAESEPGRGACFTIYLPAGEPETASPAD